LAIENVKPNSVDVIKAQMYPITKLFL
jgi:hypothetical protein